MIYYLHLSVHEHVYFINIHSGLIPLILYVFACINYLDEMCVFIYTHSDHILVILFYLV